MSIDHLPETQPTIHQPVGTETLPEKKEKKGFSRQQKLLAASIGGLGGLAALVGVGVGVEAITKGGEHTLPDSDPTPQVTQEYQTPEPTTAEQTTDPTASETASPVETEPVADWFETMKNETPEQFIQHTDAEQFSYLMRTIEEERSYDMSLLAEQTGITLPAMSKNMSDKDMLNWQEFFEVIASSSPYNKQHNGLIEVPDSEKIKLIEGFSSTEGDHQDVIDYLHDPSNVLVNGPVGIFVDSIYKRTIDSSQDNGDTRTINYTLNGNGNSYTAVFHWVDDRNTGYSGWVSE